VRGFEEGATSDPGVAAQRLQLDDGKTTGLFYRAEIPVWQPENNVTCQTSALEQTFRV
jgi:hypothetical protein